MDTRRDFLKKAALLSGTVGVSNMIPKSIQRALTIEPADGSTYLDAEHVVILMQENRSFDHFFGTLRGVRGYNDPRAITLPDNNLVWLQSSREDKTYAPFRFNIQDTKITWMGFLPHTRSSQVDAFNHGKHDRWIDAKRSYNKQYMDMPLTMGYYTREDLPFPYALADAFTICDQHFSSAMTGTWPNRLYMWSGTIRGEKNESAKAFVRNNIPYGEAGWMTFPEILEKNQISWRVYQNDIHCGGGYDEEQRAWLTNYTCNTLEWLSQYNVRFFDRYIQSLNEQLMWINNDIIKLRRDSLSSNAEAAANGKNNLAKKKIELKMVENELIKWSKENFDKLTLYQKGLYQRAFTTNAGDPNYRKLTKLSYNEKGIKRELLIPKGDILYQFRRDVDSGNLPTVSWLVAPENFSDHPSAPWYGTWYTSEILDILTKNPEVWRKTIFILTYDENDGYFDHIPPFVAPDPHDPKTGKCSKSIDDNGAEYIRLEQELKEGIGKDEARGGPIGLGFRVPMIIASPWTRGGKVCSEVFDHTSTIQFLEEFINKKFGKHIKEDTITAWRRAVCGDLTSAFRPHTDKKEDTLPFLSKAPFIEKIYNARFKNPPNDFKELTADQIEKINNDPRTSFLITQQEPGIRPSSSLPYELYVDGNLSDDKRRFKIVMEARNNVFGRHSSGAPFNIYASGKYLTLSSEFAEEKDYERMRAWHYAVAAGGQLEDSWPLGAFENKKYHLSAYGPNGFFREFRGDGDDPELRMECEYERKRLLSNKLSGNIELKIKNLSRTHTFHIKLIDNAYKRNAIAKTILAEKETIILLKLNESFNWYDFTVTTKDFPNFTKRYAGRVETGKDGYSDPAMG